MSKYTVLLLIAVLCLISFATAKKVCTQEPIKDCRKERVAPFTEKYSAKEPIYLQEKYLKTIQEKYAVEECHNKKYKIYYKKPYKTTKKVKYPVTIPYWHHFFVEENYIKTVQKTKQVPYIETYTVKVKKKFDVKYKKEYVRKVDKEYTTTCPKEIKETKRRQVTKSYKTTCDATRKAHKYVMKTEYEMKSVKYQVETDVYVPSDKKDCFKKVKVWKYKQVKVPVQKKVLVTYTEAYKKPCVKTKLVWEDYTHTYIKHEKCQKIKVVLEKYYKTHVKVVEREVEEQRKRTKYKTVVYTVKENAIRKVAKKEKRVKTTYEYKTVETIGTQEAWRWGYKVENKKVYKTRDVQQVATRKVLKHKVVLKERPFFKYEDKCTTTYKEVCKYT